MYSDSNTGTPGRNRTYGQKLRSLLLYPLSYRGVINKAVGSIYLILDRSIATQKALGAACTARAAYAWGE